MKSETLDYVLDSIMGIMTSLMIEEQYDLFKEQHSGLDWTKPDFEDAVHEFCSDKNTKEFMIESMVKFIKTNKLED